MRAAWVMLAATALFAVGATAAEPEAYRISGPVVHENLAIYFVHGKSADGPVPLTLQEALANGSVQVRETGSVNQLEVENTGDGEVFIQSGDIVKGGRQDRVLTVSLIIPPHSGALPIASFCVEQGRWTARGREDAHRFETASASVPSREAKIAMKAPAAAAPPTESVPNTARLRQSHPAYMSSLDVGRRQQEMWDGVAKIQDKLSRAIAAPVAMPESRSSLQLSLENEKLKNAQAAYVKALQPAGEAGDDIIGYVFAVNGKLNSADLYPSNGRSGKCGRSSSPRIDKPAGASAAPPSEADVLAFLKAAEGGKAVEQPLIGANKLETREAAGALFFETRVPSAPGADAAWVHRNYLAK
jgi:ARG and Rhodanese-Phosphatase-superfamily-associated Protein domain